MLAAFLQQEFRGLLAAHFQELRERDAAVAVGVCAFEFA